MAGFIKKNALSSRLASNICRGRAALKEDDIIPFYRALAISFTGIFDDVSDLPASQIFNYETIVKY